ncbi:MAG TPA: chromosome segregation protein SMC, partial [Ignavibacteria bacterium]|nr:chromosome segregation protein SMC [Ignavibacteria bacterium]
VILGPNGSGKSNISDALCFVLGRLSVKSMRAKKTRNLIFLGTKSIAPAKEAFVEIIFNNSDNVFSINEDEISIKRIVRRNGQSIYKINNKTKTRQEVLFLLNQAGIDPNGFNIILQWEIQNFVRMPSIDRRKIVEEVSGISIYESRKEKSLKELGKTEDRLKEVYTILRERTSYLKNLERERQEALRFKKLESDVKKYQASIIYFDLTKKKKQAENINLEISKRDNEINKVKKIIEKNIGNVKNFQLKIDFIKSTIQKSTGLEQEKINREIADLRAEIAGLSVKIENYENKISEILKQKLEFKKSINENENSIKELKNEPLIKKQEEINIKKKELEKLEEQRKKFYMAKSELKSIKDKIEDKKNLLKNYFNESDFLLGQIEEISEKLFDKKTNEEKLNILKINLEGKKQILVDLENKKQNLEKILYSNEHGIKNQEKITEKISKMEICPVCKSKITKNHIHSINEDTSKEINSLKNEIENSEEKINEIKKHKEILNKEIEEINLEISKRKSDLIKISNINDKNNQIKILQEKINKLKEEIIGFEKTRNNLEKNFNENSNIEQKYDLLKIEVEEISLRSKENVDSEISFKQRELERAKISLKQFLREEEDLNEELLFNKNNFDEKQELLEDKKNQEEELSKKFKNLISERDEFYNKIREEESNNLEKQNSIRNIEHEINNFNIEIARLNAEIENLETEMIEFKDVLIIKANRDSLLEKLSKTKEMLLRIGSVNLLSLKVYDSIKEQYDEIKGKAEIIEKEKDGILRVIHEIDVKKKKTFLKTLDVLNEIFSKNFSSLSQKGKASLELENRKNPFEGGIDILIKAGHGKYLDVASLSGGERVLVALSLIFAIQELNPYCFYILDEVDASLDKRNSERLANLFKKYVQKGQYIIITHNDDIISNATNLYGVSMHEGVSKIVSLKI